MDIADVDTSPTRDPEPSHSPPRSAELPESTADREPEPAAVVEPSPSGATELPIVPEPEPQVSHQVREPTVQAKVETAVEIVGAMECHGATAGGEHELDLGDLIDFHSDRIHSSFTHLPNCMPGNISHPTSLSHLLLLIWPLFQHLHRWIPSASLLTLSSQSVAWVRRSPADLQLHWH